MDDSNESNEKEAKPNTPENPQLIRLRSLTKKTKLKTKTPRSKRRSVSQRSANPAEKEERKPQILLSMEKPREVFGEAQSSPKEKPLELTSGHVEKSLTWIDLRDDELERRLEKLNRVLQDVKDEKIRRIRESVKNWEDKYVKRLSELESAMLKFAERCQIDKSELNDQISRVEEMSDTNVAIRQRIEKKLIVHGPTLNSESNQRVLTLTLNLVRGILYYTAQIRDALWYPRTPTKPKAGLATTSASEEALADDGEQNDDVKYKVSS
ncbi:hypothetical protein V3C99_010386 [Haemonchus contortus]|uniref:Coiled-coil domain-containing protein 160 n=1 Tax=Haemonchus contortus TaxID=6289 RepID=A0A7I5E9Y7_HAECO